MREPEKISYVDVCKFISDKKDIPLLKILEKETPLYGILFYLQKHHKMHKYSSQEKELTFLEIENYLEKYLAGNFNKQDALKLNTAILNSEKNFKKLFYLIEQNTRALSDIQYVSEFKPAKSNNDILLQLATLKESKPFFHLYRKQIFTGLLSALVIFMVFLLLPDKVNNDLAEYYNFSDSVPLDVNAAILRGGVLNNKTTDSTYNQYKQKFNRGMAEYLAQEYTGALSVWDSIEKELPQLRANSFFTEADERDFNLYNAVCLLALYLSKKETNDSSANETALNQAIQIFQKLPLNSDVEKYYYALALCLENENDKALTLLNAINLKSEYYNKRIILENHIKN
jgi:hypothetical protein